MQARKISLRLLTNSLNFTNLPGVVLVHRIIKYLHVPNLNYYDLSVCSKDARYKLTVSSNSSKDQSKPDSSKDS